MIDKVFNDVVVMRWPAGQRWCYVGSVWVAAASPIVGELRDDSGAPLRERDLVRVLHVHPLTVARFIERATKADKLRCRDNVMVLPETGQLLGIGAPGELWIKGAAAPENGHLRGTSGPQVTHLCESAAEDAGSSRARPAGPALQETHAGPAKADLPQVLLHAVSSSRVSLGELEQVVAQLELGEDAESKRRLLGTMLALRAEGLPFAAFARALEQLKRRRRRGALTNEAGYFVRALRGIRDEEFAGTSEG